METLLLRLGMLVGRVCKWNSVLQRERDRKTNKEQKDAMSMKQKQSSAVPSQSFYTKGLGDRRRQSWHTAPWGSIANHSSPPLVGTQTSWYTFRRQNKLFPSVFTPQTLNSFTMLQNNSVYGLKWTTLTVLSTKWFCRVDAAKLQFKAIQPTTTVDIN